MVFSANVPDVTKTRTAIQDEASQRAKQQKNCLVLYGIPEGKRTAQTVESVLSLANLSKTDYIILQRVGKPKEESCRPLKVGLAAGVRVPLLKELALKLQQSSKLSSVVVSKYATKQAQYAGFLAREERRRAQREEIESRSSSSSSPVEACFDIQRKIERATEELHLMMNNLRLIRQEYEIFIPSCRPLTYHPTIVDNLVDFYSILPTDHNPN